MRWKTPQDQQLGTQVRQEQFIDMEHELMPRDKGSGLFLMFLVDLSALARSIPPAGPAAMRDTLAPRVFIAQRPSTNTELVFLNSVNFKTLGNRSARSP
jgi:hypothetical protein